MTILSMQAVPLAYVFYTESNDSIMTFTLRALVNEMNKAALGNPSMVVADLAIPGLHCALKAVWPGALVVQSYYAFAEVRYWRSYLPYP